MKSARAGEIYLSLFDMDADETSDQELDSVLSEPELRRASRYRFPILSRRYRIGRSILRRALSAAVATDPAGIEIREGSAGKPYLEDGPAFNVSHCESLLLLGMTAGGSIGVDIEINAPIRNIDELAAANFSDREIADLSGTKPSERQSAFYRGWTRKEALIKAIGGGLSIRLDSFSVSLADTRSNVLLESDSELTAAAEWAVLPLVIPSGAIGAVGIDRSEHEIRLRECPFAPRAHRRQIEFV